MVFHSIEQAYFWVKARFMGDYETADCILRNDNIESFIYHIDIIDKMAWEKVKTSIMKEILLTQIDRIEFKDALLSTGKAEIYYLDFENFNWGIQNEEVYSLKNKRKINQNKNLYGKLLVEIRNELKNNIGK